MRLLRPSFFNHHTNGFKQDSQVEPEAPVLGVVELQFDAFFEAELAAAADLP